MHLFFSPVSILLMLVFFAEAATAQNAELPTLSAIQYDSLLLFDSSRNRPIEVALYLPKKGKTPKQFIIFSHGYGQNQAGSNKAYSYLLETLASEGYAVASIQHENPDDELLAMTGNLQETRRPNWERGVKNILFVQQALKKQYPSWAQKKLVLIGHSNGGDMSMLCAQLHPTQVAKVISLDNRRVALPRTRSPKVYSLRSSDQPADPGVLPSEEEQKKFGIQVVNLPATKHNDMDDDANPAQRKEIQAYILQFLK